MNLWSAVGQNAALVSSVTVNWFNRLCDDTRSYFKRVKEQLTPDKEVFTKEELKEFEKLTYLTKVEVVTLYKEFCSFYPEMVIPKNPVLTNRMFRLLPELRVNPFRDRIIKVFAGNEDIVTFEDFLDIMSVFSERAPLSVKTSYAFRIYDFDDDDMLSKDDIKDVLYRLVADNSLEEADCEEIVDFIFAEGDIDADGYITYAEFEHMLTKSPDFKDHFRIRI